MLRRYLSLFLVVSLLLQAWIPFAANYDWSRMDVETAKSASIFGEKILICTAEGFRWVKWSDLQDGKVSHEPSKHYKCHQCYIAQHSTGAPMQVVALDVSVPLAVLRWLPSYTHTALSGDILWRHDKSRAPPVLA